jgi:hypothetical protein
MLRPPSGWPRTSSWAPCAALTERAMDSPSPAPSGPFGPSRRNGSDNVGTTSAGTRAPLLAMCRKAPLSTRPVAIVIQPPG